ncbi:MAG: thioredoxin-like domain-containing protein [Planctomycetota bacterium]|nr:thioredoxin-like domain-containing protein [Planctomycetota bacterium]
MNTTSRGSKDGSKDGSKWTVRSVLAGLILTCFLAALGRSAEDVPPFDRRVDVPEFPSEVEWVNTSKPVQLKDLRGKFVILDFWTYCCINCMHVLPELKKLEQAYPQELVVLGVHSAKFEAEKDSQNIRDAVQRHEIAHPVVNDHQHEIWKTFGVRSWPTLLLIDPEGKAVFGRSGETTFEAVDEILRRALPYYRQKGLINLAPLELLAEPPGTGESLSYPGKILADEESSRLFIADSNHHRIVVTSLDGTLLHVIGSGIQGSMDGDGATAQFSHPQGMAIAGDRLYVADTENHLLRQVDLQTREVSTVAGTGIQGRDPWGNNPQAGTPSDRNTTPWLTVPRKTAINSPWDLLVRDGYLYIAMAGPHQIWRMDLDATRLGPYAGNGREDIVDGKRLPAEPYALGASSFAQPSGLTADDDWIYVADSEGSSVRAVPFDPNKPVRTVVGTATRPDFERLFSFGDQDGPADQARFQHLLGVAYHDNTLFVADTYNNKVRKIGLPSGEVSTLVLTESSQQDATPLFDEPAGISYADGRLFVADTNRHRIRVIDLAQGKVSTLEIPGLSVPPSDHR